MKLTSLCLKSLIEDCISLHIFTITKSSITWVGDVTKGGLWSGVFNALFALWLKYSLRPCKVYYYLALCTLQCIIVVMVVFAIKTWFYFISNFQIHGYEICKLSKVHKSKIFLNSF